ncbi:hypothetical protein C2857_003004 [Epichloe festucae Fl1]|uniref:Uncharacterized protein n=1 Tax=Epichloe festucae (strain Fl1) TaxID=877507 RepID=A0A7S9PRZ8_EPIFF|nr:hypothetical protein C2857_003004 [Epichloe festucae Fl1]
MAEASSEDLLSVRFLFKSQRNRQSKRSSTVRGPRQRSETSSEDLLSVRFLFKAFVNGRGLVRRPSISQIPLQKSEEFG